MVYPHWSPISCRSSAGQGKFASQRPTFYHCATPPTWGEKGEKGKGEEGRKGKQIKGEEGREG